MKPERINRPIVIFAKSPDERDFLRNMLSLKNRTVLCFERETICFDNLASLEPQLILLRTDSHEIIWRFILALKALNVESGILLISSRFAPNSFSSNGLNFFHGILSNVFESKVLSDKIDEILIKSASGVHGLRTGVLLGSTPGIKSIYSKLPSLIQTSDALLIAGEKGTGKESLARMIARSENHLSVFIKIDCGGIAEGSEGFHNVLDAISRMDKAQKGPITILLSKIDQLDLKSQSEVLLLLENGSDWNSDHRIDMRFIATTEADLAGMVRQNRFRKDLFYRLNVIPIYMPALRERREDIPVLMDHFAIEACVALKRSFLLPTSYLSERLSSYLWPGNLNELRNAMSRLAAFGSETQLLGQFGFHGIKQNPHRYLNNAIGTDVFPDILEIQNCLSSMHGHSLKSLCNKFTHKTEKKILRKALEITNWNRKKAAALLHISYKSMLNKIKMYEMI